LIGSLEKTVGTSFLAVHPAVREVYLAKEALHRLYSTRGVARDDARDFARTSLGLQRTSTRLTVGARRHQPRKDGEEEPKRAR
jgi:hypothetical protein